MSTCEKDLKGCFNDVSVSSDGASLEFTALDGQVNSVTIPSGGEWVYINSLNDIDTSKLKIGSILSVYLIRDATSKQNIKYFTGLYNNGEFVGAGRYEKYTVSSSGVASLTSSEGVSCLSFFTNESTRYLSYYTFTSKSSLPGTFTQFPNDLEFYNVFIKY